MKRILKIVGIATLISALLVVSIGGVVSAANGSQAGEGPSYGDCDCTCECVCACLGDGDCICDECEPNEYLWGEQEYFVPGPHGPYGDQNCKR